METRRDFNSLLFADAYYHGSFWEYSRGWTPGMAPHIIDLPIWALDLGVPEPDDPDAVWAFLDDVQVDAAREEGGVVLTFLVRERPSVRKVKLVGNDEVDEEDLREVIDIREGSMEWRGGDAGRARQAVGAKGLVDANTSGAFATLNAFRCWGYLPPPYGDEAFNEIERCARMGAKGVGELMPDAVGLAADSPQIIDLACFAGGLGLPLLMHGCGKS